MYLYFCIFLCPDSLLVVIQVIPLVMDIVKVDALAQQKISKCHFFRDIKNSFHEVTHVGLEPHLWFSF